MQGMPEKSFTVEFWARGARLGAARGQDQYSEFFSYATQRPGQAGDSPSFMDDAIRIYR